MNETEQIIVALRANCPVCQREKAKEDTRRDYLADVEVRICEIFGCTTLADCQINHPVYLNEQISQLDRTILT